MRPVVTDGVTCSVGRSVTVVRPAKTAAPIELPFGLRTSVGPRNHVLDGGPDPPWEGAILRVEDAGHCKADYRGHALCAKLRKNGRSNRDAVWVVGSDTPKES